MDAFFQGLANIAEPQVSMALVIGAISGLVIGAIPGIGPAIAIAILCLLYTSPSPRDRQKSRMPSSA